MQKLAKAPRETRLIKSVDKLDNLKTNLHFVKKGINYYKLSRWMREAELISLPFIKQTNRVVYQEMLKTYDQLKTSRKKL